MLPSTRALRRTSRPTTNDDPTLVLDGVSTTALQNAGRCAEDIDASAQHCTRPSYRACRKGWETRVATTGYLRDGLNIGTERSHATVVMRWDTRISAEEALPEISLHCSSTNRDKRVPNGCLGLIRIVLGCKASALAGEQDLRYGFMSICDAPARLVLVMRVWIGWGRIASQPAQTPPVLGSRISSRTSGAARDRPLLAQCAEGTISA